MPEEDLKKALARAKDRYVKGKDTPVFPVPGDWHSKNGIMIFGGEISQAFLSGNKVLFKKLRDVAKAIGLALCYGGTEYAVTRKIPEMPLSESKVRKDTFFFNLPILQRYLHNLLGYARKNLKVFDLFGRIRYLPALSLNPYDADNRKMIAYCERLVYNAPVQTSGSNQLKLIMSRQGSYFEKGRLNRLQGNLMVTYHPYTRIVSITEGQVTDDFRNHIDLMETGNVKVLVVNSFGDPVEEYSRPVRLTAKEIKDYGLSVVW